MTSDLFSLNLFSQTSSGTGLDHLVFGSSTLDTPTSYPHVRSIAKWFLHPGFTGSNSNNDIALIKLSSPVQLSDTVRPACLAFEDNELEIYDTCHAVGWGLTKHRGKLYLRSLNTNGNLSRVLSFYLIY